MAVEISLKVSTVLAGRAGFAHSRNRICSSWEKLQLPNVTGTNKLSSLSVSPSSNRTSRIICKAREAVDGVQVVTDTNWSDLVIASENPVLVEFWAPWCGPCRMIAPVVDELAREYTGKIACFKLNTDDCPSIATQYGIRSIPTVLFFKNGERKESIIGAVPKSTLTATIEKYLEV